MNELYMGLPIFRFYIKCTRCLAEITFKVKPLQLQPVIDTIDYIDSRYNRKIPILSQDTHTRMC